jgi:Ca2+:H+ antiporter
MPRDKGLFVPCRYIGSRFYLHNPPGDNNAFQLGPDAPREVVQKELELEETVPEVNPWACVLLLVVSVTIMAVTAEFVCKIYTFLSLHPLKALTVGRKRRACARVVPD